MTKAIARWTGTKVLFDVESGSGHKVQVDEAPIFGDDEAMRPTEMLLGALGACTGVNAVLLLRRFKQRRKSLTFEAKGEQGRKGRRGLTRIDFPFVLGWAGKKDNQQVEQPLDLP